jgi:hypothetical protein
MSTSSFLADGSEMLFQAARRGRELERGDWGFVARQARELLASEADLAWPAQGAPKILNDAGFFGPVRDYARGDTSFDGLMKTLGLRDGISPGQEARAIRLKTDLEQSGKFLSVSEPVITPRTGRIDIGFNFSDEVGRTGTSSVLRLNGTSERYDYNSGLGYLQGWGPQPWIHAVGRTSTRVGLTAGALGFASLGAIGLEKTLEKAFDR